MLSQESCLLWSGGGWQGWAAVPVPWGQVVARAPIGVGGGPGSTGAGGGRGSLCLAWVSVPEGAGPRLLRLSGQFVDVACKVCKAYLGRLEHEDIDLTEDSATDLTEDEWNDLTRQFYSLVQ